MVINALLDGRSALAIFPTGGGKSLCYQLPAILFDGLTLVISPLIALMKDQVDRLQQLGIAAARLDSTLNADETRDLYRALATGKLQVLYIAPERLNNPRFLARLQPLTISLLAIDEAHCVSEWGHNFRPEYLKIAETARRLGVERVVALTATATPAVAEQIRHSFTIAQEDQVQTGFARPNLTLRVTPTPNSDRKPTLAARLAREPDAPSIVYVTLQKNAEEVASYLVSQGLRAAAYHAGLKEETRGQLQDAFMEGRVPCIVATIAFGMGIDKANIRNVFHFNLPKSLENYMQEIGRAGRDGQPAYCEMLADLGDLPVLENFIYGDTPEAEMIASLVQWLLSQPETFDISEYELSQSYDIRPLVVRTLLTYLELDGLLRSTGPTYTEYKVAFMRPRQELLSLFDQQRAEFLEQVFAQGKQGRTWLTLHPAQVAATLSEPVQRIERALDYLVQQAHIQLKPAGLRLGYQRAAQDLDTPAVAAKMIQLFRKREERDLARLQNVCDWMNEPTCHAGALTAYFGEANQPCGKCSRCLNHPVQLQERSHVQPDKDLLQRLSAERHGALTRPRQLARFVCGVTSPQLTRAKLNKRQEFGALAGVPFQEVLHWATEFCNRAT